MGAPRYFNERTNKTKQSSSSHNGTYFIQTRIAKVAILTAEKAKLINLKHEMEQGQEILQTRLHVTIQDIKKNQKKQAEHQSRITKRKLLLTQNLKDSKLRNKLYDDIRILEARLIKVKNRLQKHDEALVAVLDCMNNTSKVLSDIISEITKINRLIRSLAPNNLNLQTGVIDSSPSFVNNSPSIGS